MGIYLTYFIKSVFLGLFMSVPGVSGGTIAMLLGIYEPLIEGVSEIFVNFKKNLLTVLAVSIGGILGIAVFKMAFFPLIDQYKLYSKLIFSLILLISIPVFYKKSKIGKFNLRFIPYISVGILFPVLMDYLLKTYYLNINDLNGIFFYIVLLVLGILLAVALILPGISFSYMLFFFGLYNRVFNAFGNKDYIFIFFMLIGVLAGILMFSKLINKLLKRFALEANLIITGFLIISVYLVLQG